VERVKKQRTRGVAYSILGMCDYLKQFPGASDIKRLLAIAADGLVAQYEANSPRDWQWFEDAMTCENAVLPHALFVTSFTLDDQKYLVVAERTCEFLLASTFDSDHFSFIGCKGWYERGRTKATFDQLPAEAAAMVLMLGSAYDASENSNFLTLQRRAFDWFLGKNDLHIPLYDYRTKGCSDGLMAGGVNLNQGAESTLSFLLSLLAIVESYTLADRIQGRKSVSLGQASLREQIIKKPAPIKSMSAKAKPKKNHDCGKST
jgi:hypothetical protein